MTIITPSALRAVVCDDDPIARRAIAGVVEDEVGEVVAETDRSGEAIRLFERFGPDILVLDLALAHGSGMEVIEYLQAQPNPPRVLVFTGFDSVTGIDADFVEVVHKPEFELLAQRLRSPSRTNERRRPTRLVPPVHPRNAMGADDPSDFYRVLADAAPDDTVVTLAVGHDDADELVRLVRRSIRAQDRLIRRHDQIAIVLVGGGPGAAPALQSRLQPVVGDIADRMVSSSAGADPVACFLAMVGSEGAPA